MTNNPPINRTQFSLVTREHILCLILGSIFGYSGISLAQPQPAAVNARDQLFTTVKLRAVDDANNGVSRLTPTELDRLFGTQAADQGLQLAEIDLIYRQAYANTAALIKKQDASKPWYKRLDSTSGIIGAAVVALALVIWKRCEALLNRLLNAVGTAIYNRWAGRLFLRPFGMRKYRQAVIRQNTEVKIPFRPNRPLRLRDVFVPLRVFGNGISEQLDATTALTTKPFTVVLGAPGAGKSMLLRSMTLAVAEHRLHHIARDTIPVLIELTRLNEGAIDLVATITHVLSQHDFPAGHRFVERGLAKGLFLIFFDGLDEVNAIQDKHNPTTPTRRQLVANAISQFHTKYNAACRVIVTCRNAVYAQELATVANQTLEIVEFTDWQIHRFLSSWRSEFEEPKSVEALLATLRDRPNIYRLSRNPLLLTIIAYLYADTEFVLPHSRAEFYQEAATILLRIWKTERNHFEAPAKRLILRHIALMNQMRSSADHDRRAISVELLLKEIASQLPALHIPHVDPRDVLDEIVQRSGLLVPVDGGTKFQFAHLTLQEFFAAEELGDDTDTLLEHFQRDVTGWREVLLLWCGLEHDSARLIRDVSVLDPVLALECIADARQISNPDIAEDVIAPFRDQLSRKAELNERAVIALSLVAADYRPRGRELFQFLEQQLESSGNSDPENASRNIANILCQTNRTEAASVLSRFTCFRDELARMGDLAVPALKNRLADALERPEFVWVCDVLRSIKTPAAARVLVPFLWQERNNDVAALCLADMIANPEVEADLNDVTLPDKQHLPAYLWLWRPFDPAVGPVSHIASRILQIVSSNSDVPVEGPIILDSRIALALSVMTYRYEDVISRDSDMEIRYLFGSAHPHYEVMLKSSKNPLSDLSSNHLSEGGQRLRDVCDRFVRRSFVCRWVRNQKSNIQFAWLQVLYEDLHRHRRDGSMADDWPSAFEPVPRVAHHWDTWSMQALLGGISIVSIFYLCTQWQANAHWTIAMFGVLSTALWVVTAVMIFRKADSQEFSARSIREAIGYTPIVSAFLAGVLICQSTRQGWAWQLLGWVPIMLISIGINMCGINVLRSRSQRRYGLQIPLKDAPVLVSFIVGSVVGGMLLSIRWPCGHLSALSISLWTAVLLSMVVCIPAVKDEYREGIRTICLNVGIAHLVSFGIICVGVIGWSYYMVVMEYGGTVVGWCVYFATYGAVGMCYGWWWRRWRALQNRLRPIARALRIHPEDVAAKNEEADHNTAT